MEIKEVEQTMSSMEIAELTGKQHSHIMRDIRELNRAYQNLYKSKIGLKQKISDLGNGRQRKDPYFELTKMQTLDLLTGYNTELRIKVNHRWAELEPLKRAEQRVIDFMDNAKVGSCEINGVRIEANRFDKEDLPF